ncbi:MAG: hypothetical protein KIT84_27515 [Labilithrix sp.]|nr:hypothetical protein [Labilithrix sp.]MCW5814807.1 hypothetical protein [Labilithrix sp.]
MGEVAQTPVVWLAEPGARRTEAARSLSEWARARGLVLVAPDEGAAAPPIASAEDTTVAEHVERELARAQEAAGAADTDAAERALARAEAILREHPEALAAAWLRAEVLRAWSSRWLRLEPRDEARARAAWQEAESLDGGRAPGIGERSAPTPAKLRVTFTAAPGTTIHVDGVPITTNSAIYATSPSPRSDDSPATSPTTRPDGAPATSPSPSPHGAPNTSPSPRPDGAPASPSSRLGEAQVELGAGEHSVVASVDGVTTYAAWIAIAGPTTIALPSSTPSACSRDAFARVRRDGERIVAPGAACPAWVAAMPGDVKDSVLVARCERDACGPLLEWRVEHASVLAVPQPRDRSQSAWPAWATWTLVGLGAATAASVALVASGVFESRPVEHRFVVGGARQE